MDILRKTIKKLSDEEYQALLLQVSGKKKNKPYYVLEATRNDNHFDDTEMMKQLQVNPSAYYTLKSRLNTRIAEILSKKVENPIRELMEEVVRVPATLYGTNRDFSIRALKEIEKQLKEYDMSNELITVYKTLALLHIHHEDYEHYNKLYNKHVAYALAISKAEQMFFLFFKKLGAYQLTLDPDTLEEVIMLKRKIANIAEMYDSHRLFVLYNIVRIYYLCSLPSKRQELKSLELEIENILKRINEIFNAFPIDTLYSNISPLVDILHYEYYQKIQNQVRADHYLSNGINDTIIDWSEKPAMHFFIIQYLNSRVEKYLADGEMYRLNEFNHTIEKTFDLNISEPYHYISFKRYIALCKFYAKDYQGAAKTIYDLRNNISLKQFTHTDVDSKLFQGLCYCLMGEDSLAQQMISSIKRQIADFEHEFESTTIFIKILKTALKPSDFRRKIVRINELLIKFEEANNGDKPILKYIKIDDALIRKMTNPIKD
jgi:hypothetical protein